MKLAIMQPYYFPYIGYFQAINAVDKYILYSNLTFIKEAWMNRNRIRLKNGKVQLVTMPLLHKSSNAMIYDVMIDNRFNWCEKFLKTLCMNYKGARHFDETYQLIESLIAPKYEKLVDFNVATIRGISDYLEIKTEIESDNTRFLDMEESLSRIEDDYSVFPYLVTHPVRKVARVLEMCKRENCNDFINAIGGQVLYSKEEFKIYGIDLHFVQTNFVEYDQFGMPFQPGLSIIDVLMHNGKEGTKRLLNEYTLI